MQYLRNTPNIIRFVLVWFALSVGVAIASPMVQPKAMDMVCTSTGSMKLVVQGDEDSSTSASSTLDCPLCASISAPPTSVKHSADATLTSLACVVAFCGSAHRVSYGSATAFARTAYFPPLIFKRA
jgi:hypothetical protein